MRCGAKLRRFPARKRGSIGPLHPGENKIAAQSRRNGAALKNHTGRNQPADAKLVGQILNHLVGSLSRRGRKISIRERKTSVELPVQASTRPALRKNSMSGKGRLHCCRRLKRNTQLHPLRLRRVNSQATPPYGSSVPPTFHNLTKSQFDPIRPT